MFQRCLADVVRGNPQLFNRTNPASIELPPQSEVSWSGLPIVFDEVFTGLYRLGRKSSASFLGVNPDIAVNAKLLTGGLVPLCTTLASNEVFNAFDSPDKTDALLHGHSYTAHAVGCQVGVDSLRTMNSMDENGAWNGFKADWNQSHANNGRPGQVWSVWSHGLVHDLSHAATVDSVFAIGTVLSISLKDAQGAGEFPEIFSTLNPSPADSSRLTCDNSTE